jgi:hypothetical protein
LGEREVEESSFELSQSVSIEEKAKRVEVGEGR